MRIRSPLLAVLVAALFGCASGTAATGGSRSVDPDLITREQIGQSNHTNAFEVVQAFRPNWLRERGAQSVNAGTGVVVYLDNTRLGGLATLRTIPASGLLGIRYFSGPAASQRWGLDHGQGVIMILTRPPTR